MAEPIKRQPSTGPTPSPKTEKKLPSTLIFPSQAVPQNSPPLQGRVSQSLIANKIRTVVLHFIAGLGLLIRFTLKAFTALSSGAVALSTATKKDPIDQLNEGFRSISRALDHFAFSLKTLAKSSSKEIPEQRESSQETLTRILIDAVHERETVGGVKKSMEALGYSKTIINTGPAINASIGPSTREEIAQEGMKISSPIYRSDSSDFYKANKTH